ncbi:hypothetical protein [Streptomyces sp. CB00316]|uniref:cyanobactin maturation protease PatG family protein n=1 Tax=Streptomyces sp. CB00316 TaxID=1703932 RepID=UPI000B2F5D59|nr:hypothetical protein [Streptomyces sp. CB00316]
MGSEDIRADTKDRSPGSPTAGQCHCGAERGAADVHPRGAPSFVYVMGQVDFRFPNPGVEQELAQSMSRTDTTRMTDREALSEVLNRPENRYLARQLCYVLTIQGVDTYVLLPRDPSDIGLLAEAVRPAHQATAIDVVIGVRGGDAPPGLCPGLALPVVSVDQIYSADVSDLLSAIERPASMDVEQFDRSSEDLLRSVMRVSGNVGATDEDRCLNFLMGRYSTIYRKAFERSMEDYSLTSIDVRPSRVSGRRRIMNVIFTFSSRTTDDVEKYFVPVDATFQFLYRTGGYMRYYDQG